MTADNIFNVPGNGNIFNISPGNQPAIASADLPIANSQDSQIGENPYKGLDTFLEDDSDLFFGRKSQIDDLWDKFSRLHQDNSMTRLLIIHGASGSGKSSLARAGLIAKLKKKPLPGQERARYVSIVPRNIPLEELAKVLAKIYYRPQASLTEIDDCKDKLSRINAEGVYDGLRFIANNLPEIDNSPLILLVDQFEELFTICKDRSEQDAFIGNLLHAAEDLSKQVSVIITLRSDFLGKYPQIDQLIQPQGFFVAAMDQAGLKEAISEPAKLAKHPLDGGMVNLLIEQTKDREGVLPLLQFALKQIWVGLQNEKEPAETLELMGGVGGALAGKAQEIYEKLDSAQKKVVRRVFLGLVQLGEGVKDTRRRTELSRLISCQDDLEQVRKVIGQFADPDERLITLSNNGIEETAEVTHEALFEHWQQLKDWLNDSRDDLRLQRRLEEAVQNWLNHNKTKGCLWRSPDLDLLQDYQERASKEMTLPQLEFFKDSAKEKRFQRQFLVGIIIVGFALGIGTVTAFVSKSLLYDEFASCPIEKGRPGINIEGTCFRQLKTSGNVGVFLSSTNFHLDRGIDAFKEKQFAKAIKLFEQAVDGDRTDPIPRIFLNNARARLRNKPPLKLAVVVSIDYYETAAKDVLRGVADAQDEFNNNPANKGPFLEIVIANDENQEKAAKKVAQQLVEDPDILGIIGHHASESTIAAQEIYEQNKIAVISPTSSSSKLKGRNFFRTVGDTKKAAEIYTSYLRKVLKLDSITVFYVEKSDYSKVLKDDFTASFNHGNGKVTREINIAPDINVKKEIDTAFENGDKALLIISNVGTNSVAIAISRKNFKRPVKQRMILIFAMSLSEQETIEKGGNAVEGMTLVKPCLSPKSEHANKIIDKWQLKNEINWRHSSSYDATQAFIKAIQQSNPVSRSGILSKLSELKSGSLSFHLDKNETAGFGLKWDESDRSNANQKYCVVKIKNGEFVEIDNTTSHISNKSRFRRIETRSQSQSRSQHSIG